MLGQAQAPAPQREEALSRRLRWLLACGAAGLAGAYFSYRVYRSDSLAALAELRQRLQRLLDSSSASALLASECSHTVLHDLQAFLQSDSDEVPQSLRQLCKLARSREVSDAAGALAASALRALITGGPDGTPHGEWNPLERALEALMSDRGQNLVSLAVSMACRASVRAFFECNPAAAGAHGPALLQQLLEFGTTARGEKLSAALVTVFVREGMKAYMGSLEGTNAWEDFLSAIGRPERAAVVDRLTRVTVNELVLSFLRRQRKSFSGEGKAGRARQAHPLHAGARQPSSQALLAEAAEATGREPLRKGGSEEAAVGGEMAALGSAAVSSCVAVLAEAAARPEVRGLLVAATGTAAFEAVRATLLTTGELVLGSRGLSRPGQGSGVRVGGLHGLASRQLGALLLFLFLPLLCFVAGRRAVLA